MLSWDDDVKPAAQPSAAPQPEKTAVMVGRLASRLASFYGGDRSTHRKTAEADPSSLARRTERSCRTTGGPPHLR